jgi:hypothetical protein
VERREDVKTIFCWDGDPDYNHFKRIAGDSIKSTT